MAQILRGEKRIEVRVGYPTIARLKVVDGIRLNDSFPARIRRIAHCRTFHQLLETEDPDETRQAQRRKSYWPLCTPSIHLGKSPWAQ